MKSSGLNTIKYSVHLQKSSAEDDEEVTNENIIMTSVLWLNALSKSTIICKKFTV